MKRRFLPLSLLLVIMILGQSIAIADNGGHYVPRPQATPSAEAFMSDLRVNQHTGLIDPACMIKAAQTSTRDEADLYWLSMGPDNMGGQTTAIVYDNRPNSYGNPNGVMYIGSKGGGVYKSYNHGTTWHQVGDMNLMVSCMVQDANGVIYVGTGDCGAAATYNGLDQQSYDNSFVGSGLYKLVNDEYTLIASTIPSANEVDAWSFINDLAVSGNKLFAATDGGLKYTADGGETWTMLVEGKAVEVTVATNGKIIASVDGQLYMGTTEELVNYSADAVVYDELDNIVAIPTASGILDIAAAPSLAECVYASLISDAGVCQGIYVTKNGGETWMVALPATNSNYGHNVYGGLNTSDQVVNYGLYNHGITVDPADENILYVCGYNLWKLTAPTQGNGYYFSHQVTDGGASTIVYDNFLHVGLHTMVFCPYNSNEFLVGTDGGVYKGTKSGNEYSFYNCNRNYITSRMFAIAPSGNATRVMGGGLDHGTVMIDGDPDLNTMSHGLWINPMGYNQGAFIEQAQAGECAFSMINPNSIFVTYKDGNFARSETAGYDWVSTNFLENLTLSETSFRLQFLMYESFEDELNPAVAKYINETDEDLYAGDMIQVMSNNNYPFWYELEGNLVAGDSIEVQDPISSRMFVAFKDEMYMTYGALNFATAPSWYKVTGKTAGFEGEPLCMALSDDCDNMFVGFKNGKFARISNINAINDTIAFDDSLAMQFTTMIALPIDGQCVTSVAVDPQDANHVVVTLGNYGNDAYVLYSTNALADEPTFASMQGDLPKMPVYASVIEMETGKVIIGTEHGIYMANAIGNGNWMAAGQAMGDVPVMQLKQQVMEKEQESVMIITEENTPQGFVIDTTYKIYPGVTNTGIIYAATYGRGLFRCENFKKNSAANVEENEVAEVSVNIYPNPAREQVTVSFEANGESVSYQVYDMMGRLVMNQNMGRMGAGSQQLNVNTSNLSSGAYILRLNQGVSSSNVKFLVF